MKVLVFNEQEDLPLLPHSVKPIVQSVLQEEKRHTDEVAVYFVNTETMCRLHHQFFDDPSPTDCISFPLDSSQSFGYHVLGEIFICPKTAHDYVSYPNNREDVYRELTLYLVHGLLHLIGYDDIEEKDEALMRQTEAKHMELLIRQKLSLFG